MDNETTVQHPKNGETVARKRRHSPSVPSPVTKVSWLAAIEKLDAVEKIFVREALKDGSYLRAAKVSRHRTPFDLLARQQVRAALLAAAPYLEPSMASKIMRPFVMETLLAQSLAGDIVASKVLLAMEKPDNKKADVWTEKKEKGPDDDLSDPFVHPGGG